MADDKWLSVISNETEKTCDANSVPIRRSNALKINLFTKTHQIRRIKKHTHGKKLRAKSKNTKQQTKQQQHISSYPVPHNRRIHAHPYEYYA